MGNGIRRITGGWFFFTLNVCILSYLALTALLKTWLRNDTTQQELYFNYVVKTNEVLTIKLVRGNITATSNFYGDVTGRVFLKGTAVQPIYLLPNVKNEITLFLAGTLSGTETTMYWNATYYGVD